jgi:hypothetical protein
VQRHQRDEALVRRGGCRASAWSGDLLEELVELSSPSRRGVELSGGLDERLEVSEAPLLGLDRPGPASSASR